MCKSLFDEYYFAIITKEGNKIYCKKYIYNSIKNNIRDILDKKIFESNFIKIIDDY